jgi:predicted metal-dependent phosphoesterase TrpH
MRLVRGAEFSCTSPCGREGERDVSVHLLGYLFDPAHPAIVAEQERLRGERHARLVGMTEKMAAAGYPVDVDTVFAHLPEGASAGRPHLARALVSAGVVGSVDEAFAQLLRTGSPYYVPKADTPVRAAVEMVTAAGGVAVIAHALARRRGRVVEPSVIVELAAAGLGGVEVDHPDHGPEDRALLRDLAARHGLLATGSSDYHGTNKTTPIAAETTAPDVLDALASAPPGPTSSVECPGRYRGVVGAQLGFDELGFDLGVPPAGQGHPRAAGHLAAVPAPLPARVPRPGPRGARDAHPARWARSSTSPCGRSSTCPRPGAPRTPPPRSSTATGRARASATPPSSGSTGSAPAAG